MNLGDIFRDSGLSESARPIRLRLAHEQQVLDDVLLVKTVSGSETLCGGLDYRLLCVSTNAFLPLKEFIALPVEVQFVTDRGALRSVCGIVAQASAGQSDGGLATYELLIRDALALMEQRINTRVFRTQNEVDISKTLLDEWRNSNPVLARSFTVDLGSLTHTYPPREFILQHNESDAAFLRRLWKRRGIAWFMRAGQSSKAGSNDMPSHTLVLFDDAATLAPNAAGSVRYHRDDASEERDGVTAWQPVRNLAPGSLARHSWDYRQPGLMAANLQSAIDQGTLGRQFAASLEDYVIDPPHAGDGWDDYARLGELRMQRQEYASKCFHAESGVRDLCVGQWIGLAEHPEIDTHPPQEREFVVTALHVEAHNNLPRAPGQATIPEAGAPRYRNRFTCVRRGVPIVPAFDPRNDLPHPRLQSAIVAGPAGEEVHCDALGRVKIRFPGARSQDHTHAQGAGAANDDRDSAWVRVASHWASGQFGAITLPRVGDEVIVDFLGGDPDKPLIVGRVHGSQTLPPDFSHQGKLPGNKYLAGIKSKEVHGNRYNQLRLDDTPGQINAQLASEHGHSQLNLGWLTHPRRDGKGEARGEGAELRSDEHVSVRAAKGILLSAWQRLQAADGQLARNEYLTLMQECVELFRTLGNYAAGHQALPIDDKPQEALHAAVKQWESGSNTDPQGQEGGAPLIGITAPQGISYATPKTIVSYAGANYDSVAQQHMQLTSGQRFNVNAGKGVSLFAHHDGIKAIAHQGKFLMQSQHDDTEINSAKNIKLTASDGKLVGMAKEIVLIAEDGSFIKIGGGITLGTNGTIAHKGASFPFSGPATMASERPVFDTAAPDQQFVLKYGAHEEGTTIAAQKAFEILMSDGSMVKGMSDAEGKTGILQRDAMHIADIRILTGLD